MHHHIHAPRMSNGHYDANTLSPSNKNNTLSYNLLSYFAPLVSPWGKCSVGQLLSTAPLYGGGVCAKMDAKSNTVLKLLCLPLNQTTKFCPKFRYLTRQLMRLIHQVFPLKCISGWSPWMKIVRCLRLSKRLCQSVVRQLACKLLLANVRVVAHRLRNCWRH